MTTELNDAAREYRQNNDIKVFTNDEGCFINYRTQKLDTFFKAGNLNLLRMAEDWCKEDLGMQNGATNGNVCSANDLLGFLKTYCGTQND